MSVPNVLLLGLQVLGALVSMQGGINHTAYLFGRGSVRLLAFFLVMGLLPFLTPVFVMTSFAIDNGV
jgi:hypothetical protein